MRVDGLLSRIAPLPQRRSDRGARRYDRGTYVGAALVAAGYYAGSQLGFALTFKPEPVAVLWLPNAILLGGLLLAPPRAWWLFVAAVLPAHALTQLQGGVPAAMSACWYVSNICQSLMGAYLVRRYVDGPLRLDSVPKFAAFCWFGALIAPFVASFLDAAFVKLNDWGDVVSYWRIWEQRFLANVLAVLIVVPAIVSWSDPELLDRWRTVPRRHVREAVPLIVSHVLICVVAFNVQDLTSLTSVTIVSACVAMLYWVALRYGPLGASSALIVITVSAIWGATHDQGPFNLTTMAETVNAIRLFLIVVSALVMTVAILHHGQRRFEEAALESEDRLGLALKAAPMELWHLDVQQTSGVSPTMPARLQPGGGGPRQDGSFLSRVHAEDRAAVEGAMARSVSDGVPLDIVFREVSVANETRWVLSKGEVRVEGSGQVTALVGVNVDVTELRRVEEQARELSQQLAHLGRIAVLGELSSTLAHELSQPLTAIVSNADAARYVLASPEPDLSYAFQILEDIVAQGGRAGEIIARMRALMQKGEAHPELLDVNDVIREVLELEKSNLMSRGIAVTNRFSDGLPAIWMDRIQLQQVMLNLITNACEAMDDVQGRALLTLTTIRHGHSIRVLVQDTGPGIPEGGLDLVFKPFYTTKPAGLGVGLSICHSIIAAHGGALSVENSPAGGAEFRVTLPTDNKGNQGSPADAAQHPSTFA